jgi:hypothetical protein
MLVILRRSLSGQAPDGDIPQGTGRAEDGYVLPVAPAAAWGEASERRFRDLVRLEATGAISPKEHEELESLADLRRRAVSPMPANEAAMQEQRLASLRRVLGALEDYVRSCETTDSPRPGA